MRRAREGWSEMLRGIRCPVLTSTGRGTDPAAIWQRDTGYSHVVRTHRAVEAFLYVVVLTTACSAPIPPPSPSPIPTPQPTEKPTSKPASGPESSLSIALAGTFHGGLWAVQGSSWLTSTDAGATWRRRRLPAGGSPPLTVAAWDAANAWVISLGPGSTADTGAPTDVIHLVVHRTTDGGTTWTASTVPGNFAAHAPILIFVDTRRGYLISSPERFSDGVSTILRTGDGGATWRAIGSGMWLGPLVGASDKATLWAGAKQSASPVSSYSLLGVSRDGGRTWEDAHLPGIEAQIGGAVVWLDGPPTFSDAANGIVTTTAMDGPRRRTRIYRTADAGRSWMLVSDLAMEAAAGPALLDANHWLLPRINPFGMLATRDGGATWEEIKTSGLASNGWIVWMDAVDSGHAAAIVPTGDAYPGPAVLQVTSDGGKNWRGSSLGGAH